MHTRNAAQQKFDCFVDPRVVDALCDQLVDPLQPDADRVGQVSTRGGGLSVGRAIALLEKARAADGSTIALLGSSGVCNSTFVNTLVGEERQRAGAVRDDDSRGRHTTARSAVSM